MGSIMSRWQDRIKGCFGSEDLLFGCHHCDLLRAAELLVILVQNQIDWNEFEKEIRTQLNEELAHRAANNSSFDYDNANCHVNKQILKMKSYFTPWLYE